MYSTTRALDHKCVCIKCQRLEPADGLLQCTAAAALKHKSKSSNSV